ncbi:hypothetical protein NKG05_12000 [Oerskovia sp. M15]
MRHALTDVWCTVRRATATVLTTGIFHGFVNPSVATVDDVGVSYVMATTMGFLTVVVPRRTRRATAGWGDPGCDGAPRGGQPQVLRPRTPRITIEDTRLPSCRTPPGVLRPCGPARRRPWHPSGTCRTRHASEDSAMSDTTSPPAGRANRSWCSRSARST